MFKPVDENHFYFDPAPSTNRDPLINNFTDKARTMQQQQLKGPI
jgi:hypothetical protein